MSKVSDKFFNRTLRRTMHRCGRGFSGNIVRAKGIVFCSMCGKEFRK